MKKKKPLVLIDANHLARRNFYKLRLSNREGDGTGAIYGTLRGVKKLCVELNPSRVAMVFDGAGGYSRPTAHLAQYKQQRDRSDNELFHKQCSALMDMCINLGCPVFQVDNVEADEVIAILSYEYRDDYPECLIVSSDKDLYQLVDVNHVRVYDDLNQRTVTAVSYREKTGLTPVDIVAVKALCGDSSDNIPGLPGIGEKTAITLVQRLGGLTGLVQMIRDGEIPQISWVDKRQQWRVKRAFEDAPSAYKTIVRNLRVIKLPRTRKYLSDESNRQLTHQLQVRPKANFLVAESIAKKYALHSISKDITNWSSPIWKRSGVL